MRTNRRAPIIFCGFLCALLLVGASADAPAKNTPAKKAPDTPQSLSAVSTGITATLPDPKHPGKLLYEMAAARGDASSGAGGIGGTLISARIKMYQNGAPSAFLTAPRAQGGSAQKSVVVTGSGGVVIKSLVETGTILTADTVAWYASFNKIVATGHVVYHNGKTGLTLTGPRAVGDTRMRSVVMTGGGHGTGTF